MTRISTRILTAFLLAVTLLYPGWLFTATARDATSRPGSELWDAQGRTGAPDFGSGRLVGAPLALTKGGATLSIASPSMTTEPASVTNLVTRSDAGSTYRRWTTSYATWYGPGPEGSDWDFYGRRTACGVEYTRHLIGLASRTLPCGQLVEFRRPDGAVVGVPVVDRGPTTPSIAFDLSADAAILVGNVTSKGKPHSGLVVWRIAP